MHPQRVVLITGASTGIGRSIADHLAKHGFTVFGTSRNPKEYEKPSNWSLVSLDVCSDESVEDCVRAVFEKAGGLDAIVNNAGYGLDGALEEATLQQAKAQFETNYFGVFRMIKAVLPFMRAQSRGHIINISAGNASLRLPFMGHYTATKCAMEALTEVLRREVKPFGINVSFIEPGFFRTNIADTIQLGEDRIAGYEPWRTQWIDAYRGGIRQGPDPIPVAKCVLQILFSKSPRLFYAVGSGVGLAIWVHRLLPENLFSLGIGALRGMFATGPRE